MRQSWSRARLHRMLYAGRTIPRPQWTRATTAPSGTSATTSRKPPRATQAASAPFACLAVARHVEPVAQTVRLRVSYQAAPTASPQTDRLRYLLLESQPDR